MCFLCGLRGVLLSARSSPKRVPHHHNASPFSTPTFKITEIEEHLKWNPYIWTGYRKDYTMLQCLISFFTIHNETGNVWSHFFAVPLFMWAMYHTFCHVLAPSTPLFHQIIWGAFFLSAIACFLGSAIYHLLFPQSITALYWLGILDFTGIAALVLGSYYPPVFYGFYCFPFWQHLYISSISLLGTTTLIAPWFRFFHSPSNLGFRVSLYAMVAIVGIVPAIHSYILLKPLFSGDSAFNEVYYRLYIMYGLYALGAAFYISKFPESQFPGKFDLWFNSHQWWHLLVVCGTLVHWSNSLLIYENHFKVLPCRGLPS